MTAEAPLKIERDGAVARLILNRPEAGNTINVPMARALMDASITCDEDESIRAVLLSANGNMFCAGGDIGEFAAAQGNTGPLLKEITIYLHAAMSRFMRMEKPMVTAVNGAAAGAGLGLAVMGDIVIAARSAKFAMAYGAIGLTPDAGASWLLPRLIGLRRTQEMAFLNQRVSGEEAAALGLVSRVVDDEALYAETEKVAAQLAASAVGAVGRTRTLLLSSYKNGLEEQMELEARSIALSSRHEGREGIAAFIEKRKPDFMR